MTAPTWNEDLHPRIGDGSFTDKPQSNPEVTLDVDGNPEWAYTPSFRFPSNFLDAAIRKVEIANNRLEKLGIEDRFTYELEQEIEHRNGAAYEYTRMTLNRPSIGFDDWTFTGAHDFTPAGEVLRFRAEPDAPQVTDRHCDHCGSKRARNRVYTIVHPEKGTMQVGASCLEAFFGTSPKGLWTLDSDAGLDDFERDFGDRTDVRALMFEPEDLMVAALAASKDGAEYVSANNGSFATPPTAATVRGDYSKLLEAGDTKERRVLARRVIRWARGLEAEPGSYLDNIRASFAGKKDEVYIRVKHLGLAVSAVSAYHRHISEEKVERVLKAVEKKELPEFLAEPGTKITEVIATVQFVKYGESNYGYSPTETTWIKMLSDSGHVLSWNASSSLDFKPGDRVTVDRATVKKNEIYRGSHQTNLTRAKLTPLAE